MYTSQITRNNPTAFLFLIDQSGSMSDKMPTGTTKAQYVADVLNRALASLIIRCQKSDGVRDYFYIGVLCYNGSGVFNGFSGELGTSVMQKMSDIEKNPLRIDSRIQKTLDGIGGYIEQPKDFAVWFEPTADGGTPMRTALARAAEEITQWCNDPAHIDSFPPTILHITDGESTDGDPEEIAALLKQLSTSDGPILMFNLHVSTGKSEPISYPADESALPDTYSKMLFRMSSTLPQQLVDYARGKVESINSESRGFVFNADAISVVDFFDIGTKANQQR